MLAAFVFAPYYFNESDAIKTNTLGSHTLYQYHQRAWKQRDGVFFTYEDSNVGSNEINNDDAAGKVDNLKLVKSHNMAYIKTQMP